MLKHRPEHRSKSSTSIPARPPAKTDKSKGAAEKNIAGLKPQFVCLEPLVGSPLSKDILGAHLLPMLIAQAKLPNTGFRVNFRETKIGKHWLRANF